MSQYQIYVCDCETTGLDSRENDVIEISMYRLMDDVQKTWCLKPFNINKIDAAALRINNHKLDDLLHQTKFGRETYLDPNKIIIEIENWIMEDGVPSTNRVMCGQNIFFDKDMLEQLWIKCNSKESFPFGRRYLDTMVIEFFLNYCEDSVMEGYSLSNLTKKYAIKNSKAHSAAADTLATKEVFEKQVDFFRNKLKK